MLDFLRSEFRRLLDPPGLRSGDRGLYDDRLLTEAPSPDSGLYLGKTAKGHYLRQSGELHLLTLAPTGAGKGIGCVLPNLLTCPDPVVVLDLKGENYRLTHERRRRMGQSVVRLDPFGVAGSGGAALNPLQTLGEETPGLADRAGVLAESMVITSPHEREPHWSEKAKNLLRGLILFVCTYAEDSDRHLGSVREILTAPPEDWENYLSLMRGSDRCGGLLRRAAAEIDRMGREERASVLSTALRHTGFLESPTVLPAVSGTEPFELRRLTTEAVSLYLLLPPDKIPSYVRLMRLWLSALLQSLIARGPVAPTQTRILFLLDEVAQLGAMNELTQAVSLLRGYGMNLWFFFQDLGQLKSLYPHEAWQSFLANTNIHQYFGIRDLETAKMLSERIGKTTVRTFNRSVSNGSNMNSGWSERERELLTPAEILSLPSDELFLFRAGNAPLRARRLDYRKERF
jgi:type IV secretion system protein VirD4